MVKPGNSNDDERFLGRAHAKPAPIIIDDEKEWEVESIVEYRERQGRGQFLVKWKGYPNSKNSGEQIEGLGNAQDLVQAWWTNNMPGEEFPIVFSGYITVCVTPTKDRFEKYSESPVVDKGFWKAHMDTDYDSEEV